MTLRRHFLRTGLGALAMGAGWRAMAAPDTQQRLLVVFLRGAYDAANVVVPYGSDFYHESRPNIGLGKPGSGPGAVLTLDGQWGLHPALASSIYPLWTAGQIAFVPYSGYEDPSRSHFDMQDKIEFGQPANGARNFQSGFLNRLTAELGGRQTVAFTDKLPTILRGSVRVPNISLSSVGRRRVDSEMSSRIARMYQGTELADTVKEGFDTRDTVDREFAQEMEAASRGAISPKSFQTVSHRIAKLLTDEYRLAFVDVGRWDTHSAQGSDKGYLADHLSDLGAGLSTLVTDLGPVWKHTTVVVISEFGRTFRENGSRGTDHGHGSALWVMGGSVRGGKVLGEQVVLSPNTLHENRDWPVLNDYRAVLGGLFARQYELSNDAIARVFPAARPLDLHMI